MTTCILYARVSTRAQSEGFSLAGQLRELRAWATENGYAVVEEITDTGGRDSKRDVLERPGINRVLDLCSQRRVDYVVAQERSRFGEHPVPDLLAWMLAKHGTALRTPQDSGEGDAAELVQMFQDWKSRTERRDTARRSRSKKLEKVRQGRIVAGHTPPFGFRFAGTKKERTLEVEPAHMEIVGRILRLVGVEGFGVWGVKKALDREGVPTPPNPAKDRNPEMGHRWSRQFIRNVISSDAYKRHTPDELAALVEQGVMAPDVAQKAPDPCGLWWYEGTDYEGNVHRVAVPICDPGIPREWVDAARKAVENNVSTSRAGTRPFWELSGGILVCGGCERRMQTHEVRPRGRVYGYYECATTMDHGGGACPAAVRLNADTVEDAVWEFVYRKLLNPAEIVRSLDGLIAAERRKLRTDPEEEIGELRRRDNDLTRRRAAYQEQQAASLMTLDELRVRLSEIAQAREEIAGRLEACENRSSRIAELQKVRDGFTEGGPMFLTYVEGGRPPYDADPEDRHAEYRRLELRVVAHSKEALEVSGVFGTEMLSIYAPSST